MKKNIFLIILTLVTVFCIIFGSFIHLGYTGKTVRGVGNTVSRAVHRGIRSFWRGDPADEPIFEDDENYDYDYDDYDDYDDYNDYDDYDNDFTETDNDDFWKGKNFISTPVKDFDSIRIDGKVVAVSVERGNSFTVDVAYTKESLRPEYKVTGETLVVSQPYHKARKAVNGQCKIIIKVPFGTKLEDVDINVNVGAIQIQDIDTEDVVINTDVGAITIDNVVFKKLKATSDVGAINVNLVDSLSVYGINAKTDLGGIQVGGKSARRKYVQNGTSDKTIKISTDIGGIEIQ